MAKLAKIQPHEVDGVKRTFTCFELDSDEIIKINETGKIWVDSFGKVPPSDVRVDDPTTE